MRGFLRSHPIHEARLQMLLTHMVMIHLKVGDDRQAKNAGRTRRYVVIVVGCRNIVHIGYVFDICLDPQGLVKPDKHRRIQSSKAR